MNSIIGSFPSGHTTSATAAMVGLFLAAKQKKRLWPVLIFPFLMGFSRIYLMVHYTSDVLAGLVAGTLGAIAAYYITKGIFLLLEKHKDKRLFAFALDFDIVELIKKLTAKKQATE